MRIPAILLVIALLAVTTRHADAHEATGDRIHDLTHIIEHQPANVDAVLERADLYREAGKPALALADYERALHLDPTRPLIQLGRALALIQQEDFEAALTAADAVLSFNPIEARAWRVRAQALAGLQRLNEAVAAFDRVLACDRTPSPDDYAARVELQTRLGDVDAAVTGLDEGIARLGSAVSLQRLAVELERRNHRYDDALTRLDRMQSQFARTETMLDLRGDILTEAGRTLEANAAYTEALHLVEERMAHGRVVPATAQLRTDLMHKLSTAEDK